MATLNHKQVADTLEGLGGKLNLRNFWRASGAPYELAAEAMQWLDGMQLTVKHHRREWLIDWRDALEIIRDTPVEFDNGKAPKRNLGIHLNDEDKGSRVVFLGYPLTNLNISLTLFINQYWHGWLGPDDDPMWVRYEPVKGEPMKLLLDCGGVWKGGKLFNIGRR